MTVQTINLGNVVNDGLGDDLRTAFQKVNANFAVLDAELTLTASNIGASGVGIFKQRTGANFEFKKLIPGTKMQLGETADGIVLNNTSPDAFTRIETDSGVMLADVHEAITFSGTTAPGHVSNRKDIEVTTSGSYVYFKNTVPVVDILTTYDFGNITGEFTNALQMTIAASNIDFGTITIPGRLSLDCGGIV